MWPVCGSIRIAWIRTSCAVLEEERIEIMFEVHAGMHSCVGTILAKDTVQREQII